MGFCRQRDKTVVAVDTHFFDHSPGLSVTYQCPILNPKPFRFFQAELFLSKKKNRLEGDGYKGLGRRLRKRTRKKEKTIEIKGGIMNSDMWKLGRRRPKGNLNEQ